MTDQALAPVLARLSLAKAWGGEGPSRLFLIAAELHVHRLENLVAAGSLPADAALAEALVAETAAQSVRNRRYPEDRHVSL